MNEKEILRLIKLRLSYYKRNLNDFRVDKIANDIIIEFKNNYDNYSIDFIIETLTKFGQAPNLIYDDNGLFAVSGDGYQPVVFGNQKINGSISICVEKRQWKKTIRLALKHYLSTL